MYNETYSCPVITNYSSRCFIMLPPPKCALSCPCSLPECSHHDKIHLLILSAFCHYALSSYYFPNMQSLCPLPPAPPPCSTHSNAPSFSIIRADQNVCSASRSVVQPTLIYLSQVATTKLLMDVSHVFVKYNWRRHCKPHLPLHRRLPLLQLVVLPWRVQLTYSHNPLLLSRNT